jgi:hypothetical protein
LKINLSPDQLLYNLKPISDHEKLFFTGKPVLLHHCILPHPFNIIVSARQKASGLKPVIVITDPLFEMDLLI